jgi:hypothetical protein
MGVTAFDAASVTSLQCKGNNCKSFVGSRVKHTIDSRFACSLDAKHL